MTHHPADARPAFMVAARDRIEAAQKLKLEPGLNTRVRETLPDLYWSLIAEAAIYADLARADYATGITAGTHMTERDARIQERREHFSERIRQNFSERIRQRQPADPPFAEGHCVRVTRGDWAGHAGVVVKTYPDNHPPIVDVRIPPNVWGGDAFAEAMTVAVLPADLELVVGADQ